MANLKNSSPVVLSFGDLKKLIHESVREARIDELKRFRGLVKSESINRRLYKLEHEGCCKSVVLEGSSKANKRRSIRVTVLQEVPEVIKQYIVRKA